VPLSAATGQNVDALLKEIVAHLPEGPQFYPPDTLTDQPERLIASEMIRERSSAAQGRKSLFHPVTVEDSTKAGRI
jgi:GTP-binding protein Era